MNKNSIYAFVKNVTPPFLFSSFKGGSLYKYARFIASKLTKEKYTPSWQTIKSGPLVGRKVFFDPTGDWQREMLEGSYDDFFFNYVEKLDLKGKIVFDIGTHIGFNSMYFAQLVGPTGKVCAFEPNIYNKERFEYILTENAELRDRIEIFEVAVSNKVGTEQFIFSSNIENGTSSGSFIDTAHTIYQKSSYQTEGGFTSCDVKLVRLDEPTGLPHPLPDPDIIKMDIEGAEYLAIEGAQEMLNRKKPLILIEIHSIYNMYKVEELLTSIGYEFELLKEESDGRCFFAAKIRK